MNHYDDEARDKVPSPIFGVPPSRAISPISISMSQRSGPNASTSRPGINRTVTSDSRLSRIASKLPNSEREVAEGPAPKPPRPAHLKQYAYHFFSPEIKVYRGIVIKILGMMVVLTTIIMWLAAPFYWGSLWKANHFTDRLTVRIIDRDGGQIGQAVTQGLLAQRKRGGLGYFVTSPSEFPTDEELYHDIVQEGAWGAVVINAGATAGLATARQTGNASYMGSEAIQFVYAQARNELATGTYMVPIASAHLQAITGKLGAQSVAEFLPTVAGNAQALALLAQAPSTLSSPVGFHNVNLRPYDQPVAQAITLVGLIYMLIFSFICTMANFGAREIISPYLTNRAYITYRLVAPFVLYLPLSFFFAMISLPFKAHFGAHFTYAGGFFCFWFLLFLGMGAVGLACEFMITILGNKFVSFFLIPRDIISNVSVAALPHELQPWIYRYGVAMPFYNANRAIRCILFNTKNDLAQNFGILLAWIVFSCFTIALATWLFRRKAVNEHKKALGEEALEHKLPDGRVV